MNDQGIHTPTPTQRENAHKLAQLAVAKQYPTEEPSTRPHPTTRDELEDYIPYATSEIFDLLLLIEREQYNRIRAKSYADTDTHHDEAMGWSLKLASQAWMELTPPKPNH